MANIATIDDDMLQIMNEFYKTSIHQEGDTIKNADHTELDLDAINCLNLNCNSKQFILDECNYICTSCGTLQDKFISSDAEWRYYGQNDTKTSDPTRCGMPVSDLFPEFSLGSVIAYEYGKNSTDMRNLYKYQKWNSTSYKERSLYNIVDSIYIHATNNGIPQSIIEESKTMYKTLSEQQISRGANRNGIIASCLYWSCKRNKVPRSSKEIANIFNIDITTMTKGCKRFHDIMKINVDSTNPKDFILRFCSNLNLDQSIIDLCIHIVDITEEYGIVSENSPSSIACGIIYLSCVVCNADVNKKDISLATKVSEVTINKCFKKLYSYRENILPSHIIQKYSVK